MNNFEYINKFKKYGVGLFVHFGLYSIVGQGEWYLHLNAKADMLEYKKLLQKFKVKKDWAKELVHAAKSLGAKYITLTTRHHDGFSLYDTCGLNEYDAPHSACGRDLILEFVKACREGGVVPFFYHTLLDWYEPSYRNDFAGYTDYLIKSIEILCRNYGKIGGFWFDGIWDKPAADWQEDRLYNMIRKYQPDAMIINNTGLSELGKVRHPEIDSVTFERGMPNYADCSDRPRAGEMCQVLNDHWGYAKNDCNYKSVKELVENLVDCRKYNCNFLLNTGLKGNGSVNETDKSLLREVGKWIKENKGFVYETEGADIACKGGLVYRTGNEIYVAVKDVPMSADPNVSLRSEGKEVVLDSHIKVKSATWLDNGDKIDVDQNNIFHVKPYDYGTSLSVRVAKIICEK